MSEPEMVERRARIFRFGHYPAKGWGITREAFIAANGERAVIPIGLDPIGRGHYEGSDSVLDGETGTAEFSVEGDEVFATLRMPTLIHRAVEKAGLKISGVFGRETNALRKIDLVLNPHIRDAVLLSNEANEVIVFEGEEPEVIGFADQGKVDLAQMHHEITASCLPGLCTGSHDTTKETAATRGLRMLHDHSVHQGGASCPGMDQHQGGVTMSDEIEETMLEESATFAEETPRERAMREKLERMEALFAEKDAIGFADSVTKGEGRRATPVERPSIIDAYRRAAALDARYADTVTFTDDGKTTKTGSHLDAFKASILVRPRIATKPEHTIGFNLESEPPTEAANGPEAEASAFAAQAAAWGKSLKRSK